MTTVQRFDFAKIGAKPTRTPQGFLRIDANLTRVGVLLYRNDDGSVRRELRHPDEVFKAVSLGSLEDAPVTDLHPSEGLVNLDNRGTLEKGHVRSAVAHDDRFVTGSIIVKDKGLIEAIERGDRRELSPGYSTRLDETPGEWNGEPYDAIQRDIVYNHLGIGPKGWGRSGSEVSLKMDSGLVSYEAKASSEQIANLPEPSSVMGTFVRAKLAEMQKSIGHLAEVVGVDVWAVESFLDGHWGCIARSKQHMDPDSPREPDTGIAKRSEIEMVANFIGVDTDTLFELVPVAERGDGRNPQPKTKHTRTDAMSTKMIKLDGIQIEVPNAVAEAVEKSIAGMQARADEANARADATDAKVKELTGDVEKQTARADAAEAQAKDLQGKLDAATSPEAIDNAVKARVELEGIARKIVGDSADFVGKSDLDIKTQVIAHTDSTFKAEGKSAEYINARFDHAAATAKTEADRHDANDEAYKAAAAARASGNEDMTEAKARQDAAERSRNAWKTPVAQA